MCYRTNDYFRQGAPVCPNNKTRRMAACRPAFLYLSLPVQTVTVLISTALIPAISRWLNGWVKTKQFFDCTAKPAAAFSANDKAHSCKRPSCLKRMWYALSNAPAMVVLLKPPQISVRLILVPYSVYWKERANVPPISIVCNSKTLTNTWYHTHSLICGF